MRQNGVVELQGLFVRGFLLKNTQIWALSFHMRIGMLGRRRFSLREFAQFNKLINPAILNTKGFSIASLFSIKHLPNYT